MHAFWKFCVCKFGPALFRNINFVDCSRSGYLYIQESPPECTPPHPTANLRCEHYTNAGVEFHDLTHNTTCQQPVLAVLSAPFHQTPHQSYIIPTGQNAKNPGHYFTLPITFPADFLANCDTVCFSTLCSME